MNHGIKDDEQAIDQWCNSKRSASTRAAYNGYVGTWRRFMNQKALADVSIDDMQQWFASLEGKRNNTIRTEVAAIKSLFAYLCKVGYLAEDVAKMIEVPKPTSAVEERYLTQEQIEQFITAAEGNLRDYCLVRFLYLTGARASEAANVCWRNFVAIDGEGAEVTIIGKGDKKRKVLTGEPLWIDLCELRKQNKGKDVDKVFGLESNLAVLRVIKDVARVAGMPNVTTHWLRHSVATHALENDMPIGYVGMRLGHVDTRTTQQYLHLKGNHSFNQFVKVG